MNWWTLLFDKLSRAFKEFLAVALPVIKQSAMAKLKDFATEMAAKYETSDFSNETRRNLVFNEIKKEALNKGIEIGKSEIYLLIELALQYVKNKKGV